MPALQPQTFLLPASLPLGRYLRVDLHGRRQQQLEDMGWYLAVQSVEAFGHQVGTRQAGREGVQLFAETSAGQACGNSSRCKERAAVYAESGFQSVCTTPSAYSPLFP